MNHFDDIQQLWQQSGPKHAGGSQEMVRHIVQQQRRERNKMMFSTLILSLTFFYILFIAFYYHFAALSTQLGLALVLVSILAAVLVNSRLMVLLYRNLVKPDTDNKTMLANMERYQRRQRFFHSYFISAYYLSLTTGLALYLYDLTRSSPLFMAIAYTLTLGWILFAWSYIRPRTIRRQTARINAIIHRIKTLENEMGE